MTEHSETAVSSDHVELTMDHGQFYLRGGLDDGENEYPLLKQALASQPAAGDGKTLVILSPHQNNFEMSIDVELFTARPSSDDDQWQQVSEDRLEIGPEGVLQIDSTTMDPVDCAIPPGDYLVQVSGRGFVNYGWPGGTTPGDVWRIRLWPSDGAEARAAIRWDMPGYGVPDDDKPVVDDPGPASEPSSSAFDSDVDSFRSEPESPAFITLFHEDGTTQLLSRAELKQQRLDRERAMWGGEPIPQVLSYNGGQDLTRYDRELVMSILAADDTTARNIATWCATAAFDFAGLSERPWVRPALDALTSGRALPSPFTGYHEIGRAFAQLGADREAELAAAEDIYDETETTSVSYSGSYEPLNETLDNPYDMMVDAASMAIPSLLSAADEYPHKAAVETLGHASHTYAANVAELHTELRSAFPGLQKSAD
ncbi:MULTISPECIES: hypothetical protein [unclassified Rhodococcus (in: high G+C Gram-positive bacteria)]|uniref:hypothetical protein n=1 Tax=unclassified Rhodococcus (in: high G+C Gram-positive bacteria) TaxID=192944 RepID=UPI001B348DED|nr:MULTISPECIES: hypothetical protein [unclassified Rhodococcus (in: high G+C Gram-positive bacteria)]